MNQFQMPSDVEIFHQHGGARSALGRRIAGRREAGRRAGRLARRGRLPPPLSAAAAPPPPKVALAISPMPASEPSTRVASIGMISTFWFGDCASLPNAFEIFLRHEVVERRDVAARDRLAHHLGRLGLGLREALARLGVAERGLAAAFGFEDLRLLLRLRPSGSRTAAGLRPCRISARFSRSACICRPIDCTRFAGGTMSLISMRLTLTPHGDDRGIDHAQQPLVDLVAMREHLVEVHRAHHRADVGHRQLDDRLIEIGDLVARLGGVEHLDRRRGRRP